MKRIIFILTLLLTAAATFAQTTHVTAKSVQVQDSLRLTRWITAINDDTTSLNGSVRALMTENAVYDFVTGRTLQLWAAILDTAEAIRDDFSNSIPDGDKGDITVSGSTWTIDPDVVTYAKMQNVSASNRFMGRFSTGSGNMEEMTPTVATGMLDLATPSLKGLAPASGGGTTNFLRADMTWAVPPGGGGGGGTYTVSNLGGGLDNFSTQSGNDFRFNTFGTSDFDLGSNLITIDYANGQKVTHSVPGFATAVQATRWDSVTYFRNTGATGEGLLVEITPGFLLGFKKLIAGTDIDFDVSDSSLTINSTASGGPGGGRFGVSGEDDEAAEPRTFDLNAQNFAVNGEENSTITLSQTSSGGDNTGSLIFSNQNVELKESSLLGEAGVHFGAAQLTFISDAGDYIFETSKTPASSGATGTTGMFAWDGSFFYICVSTNTWRRVAHSSW